VRHHHGVATRTDKNTKGHEVLQLLADYQDRGRPRSMRAARSCAARADPDRDAWLRVLTFDTAASPQTLRVRTYSPHYKAFADQLPELCGVVQGAGGARPRRRGVRREGCIQREPHDFRARFGRAALRR
jgi:hypothetical protein